MGKLSQWPMIMCLCESKNTITFLTVSWPGVRLGAVWHSGYVAGILHQVNELNLKSWRKYLKLHDKSISSKKYYIGKDVFQWKIFQFSQHCKVCLSEKKQLTNWELRVPVKFLQWFPRDQHAWDSNRRQWDYQQVRVFQICVFSNTEGIPH